MQCRFVVVTLACDLLTLLCSVSHELSYQNYLLPVSVFSKGTAGRQGKRCAIGLCQGFNNLYTLEGGVHAYLRWQGKAAAAAAAEAPAERGDPLWKGSLFVFDNRLAVPPPGAPQLWSMNVLMCAWSVTRK